MKNYLGNLYLTLFLFSGLAFASPTQIEFDSATLNQVLRGQIVKKVIKDKGSEYLLVQKAWIKIGSPQSYIDLAVDHKYYPQLFKEVSHGETLNVLTAPPRYEYEFDATLYGVELSPRGVQTFQTPDNLAHVWIMKNVLTNYKNLIRTAKTTTLLQPYRNGVLVQETLYLDIAATGFKGYLIKSELKKFFARYVPTFKKALEH